MAVPLIAHLADADGNLQPYEVLGIHFTFDGMPWILTEAGGYYHKPPNAAAFQDIGLLAPYVETSDPQRQLEVYLHDETIGQSNIFFFHRYCEEITQLIHGSNGKSIAFGSERRSWTRRPDSAIGSGCLTVQFVTAALDVDELEQARGPRFRPSALAEHTLALA